MSLFRKPKKFIQRRVFSTVEDDGGDLDNFERANSEIMDVDEDQTFRYKRHEKKEKVQFRKEVEKPKTKALLSFADDDEEDEVFQVRKSSHSKKVMRMLDKERRKKKAREGRNYNCASINYATHQEDDSNSNVTETSIKPCIVTSNRGDENDSISMSSTSESSKNKVSDNIETEIRTDDFVLVVKKSEQAIILNGRAAICAGKDDLSDEDNGNISNDETNDTNHMFSKPEQLKQMLESGSIPDAATIHAVRKRRQKAREQGDVIPMEELKDLPTKGKRLNLEDDDGKNSDEEERVDMNAITGKKEIEERREQFYSVENDYSDDDSDRDTNEWENQQIRKGVTGAQLVTAQQESVLYRFLIKSTNSQFESALPQSTSKLLDEAYAKSSLEKSRHLISSKRKNESVISTLSTSKEISDAIKIRLMKLREHNETHEAAVERIKVEINLLKLTERNCAQKSPIAAAKYRFFQEINGYVNNLVECLNEKQQDGAQRQSLLLLFKALCEIQDETKSNSYQQQDGAQRQSLLLLFKALCEIQGETKSNSYQIPIISELEERAGLILSRLPSFLIERRRQDVRDQVKEMTDSSSKILGSALRRGPEFEELVKRTAERECRRTRRRCEREKSEISTSHLDGMSSDDEVSDRFLDQQKSDMDKLEVEVDDLFADTGDDFFKPEFILLKFKVWRNTDMESYKDAFVSLCLPKIIGPLARIETLLWNPLNEDFKDIENMNWYLACMLFGRSQYETEESLAIDPDIKLVPTIIEKILLPKITETVSNCWDPMSTTQNLRLIGLINRIGRDFPIRQYSVQLQDLFGAILDRMKSALNNDIFIPIFPKQIHEARTSFFQRQLCSGLKLFRNYLSWQGIIADNALRDLAISSLLNQYLLIAMKVCSTNDALSKAYIVVNTLPTAWLQLESEALNNLQPLIVFIKSIFESFDPKNPLHMQSCDKAKQILQRLHSW